MSTKTLTPEPFPWRQIYDYRDEMTARNLSLKALGVLLENANLERFSDDFKDAGDYRAGLNRIIELITEQQERMVDELVTQYDQSRKGIIHKEVG